FLIPSDELFLAPRLLTILLQPFCPTLTTRSRHSARLKQMKATNILLKQRSIRACVCLLAAAAALVAIGGMTRTTHKGLVAHEWGTFTSVQGSDGVLLDWQPLQTSRLPGFVYDWTKPGLNRRQAGPFAFTKRAMVTLQRMETPVIYFYSDRPETVDVSV